MDVLEGLNVLVTISGNSNIDTLTLFAHTQVQMYILHFFPVLMVSEYDLTYKDTHIKIYLMKNTFIIHVFPVRKSFE